MLPPICTDFPSIQDALYALGVHHIETITLQAISGIFLCGLIVLPLDQEGNTLAKTNRALSTCRCSN